MNMYKQYDKDVLQKLQMAQLEILKDFIKVCEKNKLDYFMVFGSALGTVRHKGFIPWDDDIDVGMLRTDYDRFLEIAKKELSSDYNILTPYTNKDYACSVTHFEKKGTSFIPEFSKYLKCNIGINIDIFAFDNISDNQKDRMKQVRESWFWGRLLFLRGTPFPYIPIKGVKGFIAKITCILIHYILVIFRVKAQFMYKQLLMVSKKYNDIETKEVTCFEDPAPLNNIISKEDIFPLVEFEYQNIKVKLPKEYKKLLTGMYGDFMKLPPIDKRINHNPYKLDFGEGGE